MSDLLDSLQVFCGDANEHTARVYVAVDVANRDGEYALHGVVRGPYASSGLTLPARFQLRDLPGETLLAATVVTDPCFWLQIHPAIYEVEVELRRNGEEIATASRKTVFRPMGVRQRDLLFRGKRRVLRAVHLDEEQLTASLPALIETNTIPIVRDLTEELGELTLHKGVPLIADLRRTDPLPVLQLIANQHAVIGTLLEPRQTESLSEDPRNFARSTMFIADLTEDETLPEALPEWASLGWVRHDQLQRRIPNYAVIATDAADSNDWSDRRRACDQLQAALAPVGQFAGYAIA